MPANIESIETGEAYQLREPSIPYIAHFGDKKGIIEYVKKNFIKIKETDKEIPATKAFTEEASMEEIFEAGGTRGSGEQGGHVLKVE